MWCCETQRPFPLRFSERSGRSRRTVIRPYPWGVRRQPPSGSPSAASNPADTSTACTAKDATSG